MRYLQFVLVVIFFVAPLFYNKSGKTSEPKRTEVKNKSNKKSDSLAIFNKRILPIFQSQKPSSCTECHLSGVDLKDYIQGDQKKTFASLVKAKLIDVEKPLDSKILKFIQRQPNKPNLITKKVRQQEYKAFRAWILAALKEPELLAAKSNTLAGPQLSDDVIRHARKDRVLTSFIENIWSEVGRCAACHSPDRNQKQVRRHGKEMSWIILNSPVKTMQYMIDQKLINVNQPEKSLLITKPTMQVKHGGGKKMMVGDQAYKQFRRFLDDYSAVINKKYQSADDLPQQNNEVSFATEIWLKITNVPPRYNRMLMQVDLYRKTDKGWSTFRVASTDHPVFGKKRLWQHSLSLTAPRDSNWSKKIKRKRLPPGRYLIKIYIDKKRKLQKDTTAQLGRNEFVGQVKVQSRWRVGHQRMTVVKFPRR